MTGGNDGTTVLETPPYVIAMVFFLFLVISLGFEKLTEWLRGSLQRRGKHGLLSAMSNMQSELMCLGLATLVLLLFQSNITGYCISANRYTKTWLDHVSGCSCCLARTRGVSACYYAAKSCISEPALAGCCSPDIIGKGSNVCDGVFDISTDWDVPSTRGIYTVNAQTGEISTNSTSDRRRLLSGSPMRTLLAGNSGSGAALRAADEVQCEGRIQTGWEECGFRPDHRPAISVAALHQVHIFIFITAIVHIALGVVLIIFAGIRLHFWSQWRDSQDANAQMVQQAIDEHCKAMTSAAAAGQVESQGELLSDQLSNLSSTADPVPAKAEHPSQLPESFRLQRARPWEGRPESTDSFCASLKELWACCCRQFVPNVVTREEFSLMRSAFMLTHQIHSSSQFRYLDYLRAAMEDDFAHVVGLGFPMWCFIIVFVLLSSAIGWCIWVFVIISGALLAAVNMKLIWVARYVTRGGHVHRLKPGTFWLNRPWLLLPIIKFLLFFVSYVYANAIFFAAEFGPTSCFFSRAGFQGQPVPWWVVMVVNTIFLASLSLLTLPLYSVTVQMGGDFKANLVPKEVIDNAAKLHKVQAVPSTGFRRMLSRFIPRERDMALQEIPDNQTTSLVNSAALSDKER